MGGGGSGATTNGISPTQSSATDVTVERGKVYNATVTDSSTPPQTAKEKAGLNVYTFAKKPTYPVMATGGWIDVNGDAKKDAKDVDLDITLKSYSNTVTPVTTYIADANKTIRENRLEGLKDRLNANGVGVSTEITEEELLKVPSKVQNSDFSVLVNAIYKDMKEHGGNLDNSNEDSILSQFDTVKGLTLSTNPKEIEAAVMSNLVGAGYANYIPTSELPDKNTTTPPDNNTTASSSGIYIAQTHNSIKTVYQIFGSPLLHDSKAYVRLDRGNNVDGLDVGMKVLSYDLSKFNRDMNISDLPTNILYEQVGPNYDIHFNQSYYDIAELNNQLYFATMPESVDTLSQSSFIKYDIASDTEIYNVKKDPVYGKNLNTTFDLAKGWFLPFDSGSYMGIVDETGIKVIDTSDGSSYKYGAYDYYGGSGGGDYISHATPVGSESGFFYAQYGDFLNISYLSDHTKYGERETRFDPGYKVNDIFADFNATYSGAKAYTSVVDGAVGTAAPILILDGDTIYTFVTLRYVDSHKDIYYDLYLLKYGTDSTLKSATFIDGSTTIGNYFDVYETYKYGDSLFFKFRHDGKNELCAYNLTKKSFTFRHEIGNNPYMEDMADTSYVITGDTIVMPEYVNNAKEISENDMSYYDLVFKVLNINDGSLIKTLHHPDLDNLQYTGNDVRVGASLSDKNAIYFFAERTTENDKNNLIIKIDSPSNRVQKTRNRFDNHLTGVIRDSQ